MWPSGTDAAAFLDLEDEIDEREREREKDEMRCRKLKAMCLARNQINCPIFVLVPLRPAR